MIQPVPVFELVDAVDETMQRSVELLGGVVDPQFALDAVQAGPAGQAGRDRAVR